MGLAARLQRSWWRPGASGWAVALSPVEALYRALSGLQRDLYRFGLRRVARAPMPVVVVGNLIAGGAGKTPTVIALVRALRQAGWTPGVVSRGYGRSTRGVEAVSTARSAEEVGDEPLLIHLRTGAPVVVGRDRVAAAEALCRAHPSVDLLISDDGLQHWRLARDLQVLVFDERGAGNGRLLPAGPLREAMPSQLPLNTLVVYNAPSASTPLAGCVADRRLSGAVSLAEWWRGTPPSLATLHALGGAPVVAAAGMAHPERFFRMLEDEGLQLQRLALPDHHAFRHPPWPPSSTDVVVTEKDAIKLHPDAQGGVRVWVVALDLRLPAAFIAEAQRILRSASLP